LPPAKNSSPAGGCPPIPAAESEDPVNYRFNFDTYRSEMLPENVVPLEQPLELEVAA
jgi:hypothetical protein